MDDELQTLESELKRMRPSAPPAALVRRVGRDLERSPAPWRRSWFWGVVLPAAAAAAVLIAWPWSPPVSPPATPRAGGDSVAESETGFKPVAVENVLYSAQDEGIVTLADGTPARRERLRYMDTILWRNARTNASLTWTVPREEVRFVPVSVQ